MSGKRKANFALGFSWGHENDECKWIRKACTLVLSYFVSWSRQACKAGVGKTDIRESHVLKRKNQTQIDVGSFSQTREGVLFRCSKMSELKSWCQLNLHQIVALWGVDWNRFTEKITRKSIQRNCLFPLSVLDPPNFFWFSIMGGFVGAGLLHVFCKGSIENIQSMNYTLSAFLWRFTIADREIIQETWNAQQRAAQRLSEQQDRRTL